MSKLYWHTEDSHSPTLSKASLGDFFYTVLSEGAEISSVWPFASKYPRSSVFVVIKATAEQKQKIEDKTKFKFKPPPKIHVN